jgi:nucleoside-diphosphate-sugar epimerase
MRVFVAGATGAIGRPLIPQLVAAGHEVTGTSRSQQGASQHEQAGAAVAACDVLDAAAVRSAVEAAAPDVIVSQLTKLPARFNPRTVDYGPTNLLRREGTRNLVEAASVAGTRRLVSQSIAFLYAPQGDWVKDENAAVFEDAPAPFGDGLEATLDMERQTLSSPGLEGVVLRYGFFYGSGTYYASDGTSAAEVRKRRQPLVGHGDGVFSWIHVEDAAAATVAALDRGSPGIYNVVDDEPAPMRDWLPVYAEAVGAKPPRRVPRWLARLVAGRFAATLATELRGASNAKAKRELGWEPRYPSWRQGFREALG